MIILCLGSFLLTFHPTTGSPVFPGIVANEEQGIDIVRGVFPSVLVQYPCLPGQAHGSQAVILGYHNVPRCNPVYQGEVNAVCPFVKDQGFGAGEVEFVGGIAQNQAGYLESGPKPKGNVHHRTAVGIDQDFHVFTSQ